MVQFQRVDERFTSQGGIALKGIATEGELRKVVFDEVTDGELADEPRILIDKNEVIRRISAVNINDRTVDRLELQDYFGTPDSGDETIVLAECFNIAQIVPIGEFKHKVTAFPRIGGNAFAKASSVVPMTLDEESDSLHLAELYHKSGGGCCFLYADCGF